MAQATAPLFDSTNRYTFAMSAQCPLVLQLRKYRCVAANDH